MDLINEIVERAKASRQRIVLPEGTEERTLTAADRVLAEGVADLIILGNPAEIKAVAAKLGLQNIDKATIIDPENHPKKEEYAQLLAELRKKKGMTIEEAAEMSGIGRNTMRALVDWGKLPVLKVGRKTIIRTDTLERFMTVNQGRNLRCRDEVKEVV